LEEQINNITQSKAIFEIIIFQIEVLPIISEAVGDKIEVYIDGGIRQGIDVFKALALGARMVIIKINVYIYI
jgi:dihydroorotate dehydrogenase